MTSLAPEIYKGEVYDHTVDIYSLGMVMYRLMNKNRMPFLPPYPQLVRYKDQEQAMILRMRGEPIPMPCDDHGRLAEIVLKACSYRPEDRYSSISIMRKELEDIMLLEMSENRDFVIKNGVLIQYTGSWEGVEIPDGVTSIGNGAFLNCSNLISVKIPDSVTSIGDSALSGCWSLKHVIIPDSVKSIGNFAFRGCAMLEIIRIRDTVTNIGEGVFSDCFSLLGYGFPEEVSNRPEGFRIKNGVLEKYTGIGASCIV
jgi:serine/threonine protein kinase